ncbi:MAG: helix-turn-helix domain-containing protein [Glutamicibacter sp.]
MLGLTDLQESVYRRLVAAASATAAEIAQDLGLSQSEVTLALESLEKLGLAARSVAAPEHFNASPPELALGSLIVDQQQELRKAELELHALAEMFHKSATGRAGVDVIDIVRGPQAVAQHFAQLQRGAKRSVWAMVKSDVAVVDSADNVDEEAALARGVKYKVIVESGAFNKPGFAKQAALSSNSGEEIRLTDSLPLRMLIADQELALLPLNSQTGAGGEIGALLLRPSGLLDAMRALYELCWKQAQPTYLSPENAEGFDSLDESDRHLLVLLRAGITDNAIAGQLSVSLRTVQRRLQLLMNRAEVSTRFQLGIAASRLGWLE